MFGRRRDSLQELIRAQREEARGEHEETMVYLRRWDKEMCERRKEFDLLMEASERRTEETREYNREILLRNEKVYSGVIVRMEEMGEQIRSNTEETRAQTKALLRVLDRLDGSDGVAAA